MTDSLKLVTTEDGSHSLLNTELDEHYHSIHGAMQESMHVFIKQGLNYWLSKNKGKSPFILEIGMGTGLNVLLTVKAQLEIGFPTYYETLEPFPIGRELSQKLNYVSDEQNIVLEKIFQNIHSGPWGSATELVPGFELVKQQQSLDSYTPIQKFDLIYFDAFAPNKQPDMWAPGHFEKLYSCMNDHGILVTYCAKGQFKRDLKAVGFTVETLDGPPGKKEMVRAVK